MTRRMREALALAAPLATAAILAATVAGVAAHPATGAGHAIVAPPRWTDGVAVCMAEDGSTPGQTFPCRWDARYQSNGRGESFTLTAGPDMDASL